MYVVFARKYRPQRFEDVVGQDHITRTLQSAVRSGRVAHAYLFCGSRGVGKTTVARILAKALNCKDGPTTQPCCQCDACRRIATGDDVDVMEIDGASNRGIDEVRDLRQNVRLAPSHSRFKIYYIDEVHMLTEPAFNALLKTLEEPPGHVKFIFSTTDPQKLPDTVKSRCQRLDFRRVSDEGICRRLEDVCRAEGIEMADGVAAVIARAARGGMRDALGTLDQLAAFGEKVQMPDVLAVLGAVDRQLLERIVDAVSGEDPGAALRAAHEVLFGGTDPELFADQLSEYLRDLLVASYCGVDDPLLSGAAANRETLKRQSEAFGADQLTYMIQVLREAKLRARRDTTGRIAIELALIKMCRLADLVPVEEALGRLSGSRGAPVGTRATAGPQQAEAPPVNAAAVGVLRRISRRLKDGRNGNAPTGEARKPPEGMDELRYRQVLASADDPELARAAMEHEPLRKALADADNALGLEPVRLEKVAGDADDSTPEADDEEAGAEEGE